MIEKSQVLSTAQQIELRKLELELEALREQIQCRCNLEQQPLIENSDRLVGANAKTTSNSTLL